MPADDKSKILSQRGGRVEGTCAWLLEEAAYTTWWSSETNGFGILAITGSPGSGKTMMSTFLVETIEQKIASSEVKQARFAFFFCAARDRHRSTALSILRAWMYQFAYASTFLQNLRSSFAARNKAHSDILSDFNSLWQVFVEALKSSPRVLHFLLLDALDECPKQQRELLLSHCLRLQSEVAQGSVRLILTCRSKHHFLPAQLRDEQQIQMRGEKLQDDLIRVVAKRVNVLHQYKCYHPELRKAIEGELLERGNGSHLWTFLAMRELERADPSQALRRLRTIPRDLFACFDEILAQVPASHVREVRFLLHLRLTGPANLTTMDIAVAQSLLPGNAVSLFSDLQYLANDFNRPSLIEVWEQKGRFEKCTDLVNVDDNGYVDFIHPTVADYLLQARPLRYRQISHLLAVSLLTILVASVLNMFSFKVQLPMLLLHLVVVTLGCMSLDQRLKTTAHSAISLRLYQFARLLSQNISPRLIREIYCTNLEQANLCAFQVAFQSISTTASGVEDMYDSSISKLSHYSKRSIHVHAYRCRELLDQIFPWQAAFSQDKSKSLECWLKQEARHNGMLIDKIIKTDVNIDTCIEVYGSDDQTRTPLIVAAMNGNNVATSLLLAAGATINYQDGDALTALHHAALRNYTSVVDSLLEAGADVNTVDVNGDPPTISALKEQTSLCDTLYENISLYGDSIAFVGHIDIVNEAAMRNHTWVTSHSRFPNPEREHLILKLIENGADLNARDREGQSLLSTAAMNHRWRLVEELLDRGADPNGTDAGGTNALLQALWSPRTLQCIRSCSFYDKSKVWVGSVVVFDTPTDASVSDTASLDYSTAYVASVVSKLIRRTLDLEVRGPMGRTALSIAAENGHFGTVKELLRQNANPNTFDDHGMSPLMWGCQRPHFRRLLIENLESFDDTRIASGIALIKIVRDSKEPLEESKTQMSVISYSTALRRGCHDIIAMLAPVTADLDRMDEFGLCALRHAQRYDMYTRDELLVKEYKPSAIEERTSLVELLTACGASIELMQEERALWKHIFTPVGTSCAKFNRHLSNVELHSCQAVLSTSLNCLSVLDIARCKSGAELAMLRGVAQKQGNNSRPNFALSSPYEMIQAASLWKCLEVPYVRWKSILTRDRSTIVQSMPVLELTPSAIKVIPSVQYGPESIILNAQSPDQSRAFWGHGHDTFWSNFTNTPLHVLIESLLRTEGLDSS